MQDLHVYASQPAAHLTPSDAWAAGLYIHYTTTHNTDNNNAADNNAVDNDSQSMLQGVKAVGHTAAGVWMVLGPSPLLPGMLTC